MLRAFSIALSVITLVLIALLARECNENKRVETIYKGSDTVYVEKINVVETIKIKEVEKPERIIIQLKPDTTLRKDVERKKIILGVEKIDKRIIIQSIDTLGIITQNEFQSNEDFKINSEGILQFSHKKRNKKIAASIVGAAIITGLILIIKLSFL